MEKSEMAVLLSLLSAADGRHVNNLAIETWHEVAGHLDFVDARAAVMEHVATSDRHMTLAQLLAGASEAAERRAPHLALADSTPDLMFEQWCRENGTTAAEYRRRAAQSDNEWVSAIHRQDRDRRAAAAQ